MLGRKHTTMSTVSIISIALLAFVASGCSQYTSPYSDVLGNKSHDQGGYGRSYDGHNHNTSDNRDDENHGHGRGGSSYGGHGH